jgi:CubicO group peptidase (beta-lactamase class C family)
MPCRVAAALVAALVPLTATSMTGAQESAVIPIADRRRHVEEILDAYRDVRGFNGVVLAAVGDDVVIRKGYGLANADHQIPNAPETVFRLASVTKQFTAAAILLLAERGLIDLDAPVSTYLPDLRPEIADRITLRHVLSHTAGLERDIERYSDKGSGDHFQMAEIIDLANTTSLRFEPGSDFRYSNIGYVLAAAVIESVTGMSYAEAMSDLLFEPLGMADTGHEMAKVILPRRAEGMMMLPDGLMKAEYEDKSYVTGAGSIYSTVDDLAIWSRAMLEGRVLSEDSFRALTTAHAPGGYAYGWFTFDYSFPDGAEQQTGHAVSHGGACPGFLTELRWYLDHDIVVVVLANARPVDVTAMADAVGNILLGIPQKPPEPLILDELVRIALRDGVEAAVRRAGELGAEGRELPGASQINLLGYDYVLHADRPVAAIRVQELQIALHPDVANAYDSLGEACEAAGRVKQAVTAYRRCLELDPEFGHARERLEALEGRRDP